MSSHRWLAQLEGEEDALEDLPRRYPDDPVRVVLEEGGYFLTGSAFESLDDHEAVRSMAETEVDLLTATAKLHFGQFSRPRISTIYHIDPTGARSAFVPGVISDMMIRYKVQGIDGCEQRPTQPQRHVEAARSSRNLLIALQLWADDARTWPRLYRVLEEIELSFGGRTVDKLGFCSNNERERFTRSADNAKVSGLDARHADGGKEPPKRPMTAAEGAKFIQRLLLDSLERHARSVPSDA